MVKEVNEFIITYKYRAYLNKDMQIFMEKQALIYQLMWNQLLAYKNYKLREYEEKHNVLGKLKDYFGEELINLINLKVDKSNKEEINQKRLNIYNSAKKTGLDFGKDFFEKEIKDLNNIPKDTINNIFRVVNQYKFKNIYEDLKKENKIEHSYYVYNAVNKYNSIHKNNPVGDKNIQGYKYITNCLKDEKSHLYKKIEEYNLKEYVDCFTQLSCVGNFINANEFIEGKKKATKHDLSQFVSYQKTLNKKITKISDTRYKLFVRRPKGKNKQYIEFINDRKEIETILKYGKNITITKDSLNRYYVCFQLEDVENGELHTKIRTKHDDSLIFGSVAGIDIGRTHKAVLTDSNNETTIFNNGRLFNAESCSKLHLIRKECRDCKGKQTCKYHLENHCNNCDKCLYKMKIDKINNKIKNMKRKLSKKMTLNQDRKSKRYWKLNTKILKIEDKRRVKVDLENHLDSLNIVKKYQTIKVEDINLQKLMGMKKQKMNKNGNDKNVNLGKFRTYIEYKSNIYGRKYIKVDPANTSQICNNCGVKKEVKLDRSDKEWVCSCGSINDRDINASKNIRDKEPKIEKKIKKN